MTNKELFICYRDTVILLSTIKAQIAWNLRHGLPVQKLQQLSNELVQDIIRFENIIFSVNDIRIRNIMNCRYALGMSTEQTAETLNVSTFTINRLEQKAWIMIQAKEHRQE